MKKKHSISLTTFLGKILEMEKCKRAVPVDLSEQETFLRLLHTIPHVSAKYNYTSLIDNKDYKIVKY